VARSGGCNRIIVAIALVSTFIVGSVAGGAEPKARPWEGAVATAVIYGDVVSVEDISPKKVRVTINVKCTLMGPYDAAANPTLTAATALEPRWMGSDPSRYRVAPPRPKTHVVAQIGCVCPLPWTISYGSSLWGMALHNTFDKPLGAVVEVTGIEDPKAAKIIAQLRKFRAENPLAPWDVAHDAIVADWANRKTPDGTPITLPRYVEDFIHAHREATWSSRRYGGPKSGRE
jgi:hypothetical protein